MKFSKGLAQLWKLTVCSGARLEAPSRELAEREEPLTGTRDQEAGTPILSSLCSSNLIYIQRNKGTGESARLFRSFSETR